jgi:hypothetical protein
MAGKPSRLGRVEGQIEGDDLVRRLRRIHSRLLHKKPLIDPDLRFLTDGIGAYLDDVDHGRSSSLDRSLSLKGTWGGVSPARRDVLYRRDKLIRALRDAVDEWRDKGAIALAPLMSLSAQRYESQRWIRERDGMLPPDEPAATWWRILSAGGKIPGAKRLRQILEEEIQDPFEFLRERLTVSESRERRPQ